VSWSPSFATHTSQPRHGQPSQGPHVPRTDPLKTCAYSHSVKQQRRSYTGGDWTNWATVIYSTTFGSVSKYDRGTCISERTLLFISMAILWIWLACSLFCCTSRCVRSERPASGTQGSGNHHLEYFLVSLKDWFLWSAYQNSGFSKLSSTPSKTECQFRSYTVLLVPNPLSTI
jgi:hypothetical protein